ncbi:polyprenyl synthetase family protein [Micromonospora sp. WMMD1120]|uniref:polyprenyl synthetase family protein n=1 Tax=Micromonospora sp. WMMD1120 TaxID=3016106 RepID=UPI0024169813|nr:polyprenyl synthetase family protein [Micromonospora sp. WMMD1120]MDG4810775.1 polyprenyl synthetase family protein [Micromonospora sp. WMMD1120]
MTYTPVLPAAGRAGSGSARRTDIRACVDSFDAPLASMVHTTMAEVEAELRRRVVAPGDAWLSEAAGHLIRAGGKRLRPLLVILSAQTSRPNPAHVLRAAIAVELMHVATLHHDDVMDNATLRHGVPSANARWGNRLAVLVGDHLMAVACMTALEVDTKLVRRQGWTLTRLVRGQAAEGSALRTDQDAVEHYLQVASDKSASLFALCGWAGAACGGADEAVAEALAEYGEALGIAFQISDDLLDIVADSAASGKTRGIDLQKGVRTLPILHALDVGDHRAERLGEILAHGAVDDPALRHEALELLRTSPGLERCYDDLRRHAAVAENSLARVPDGPARDALLTVADFVVKRTY